MRALTLPLKGQQSNGSTGEDLLAPGELLAPRGAGIDESPVGGTGQFHDGQGGLLLDELRPTGFAYGNESVHLCAGASVVGVGLPCEVGVLHLEQVQVAHRIEDFVAAEQPGVDLREGPGDVLFAVDAQHLVVDEGAGDGTVLGVDTELQVPGRDVHGTALPIDEYLVVVETNDHLTLGHFRVLGHDPGDVETHVETVRHTDGNGFGRDEFTPAVDLETVVAGFHRHRWLL